jgi:serpin B
MNKGKKGKNLIISPLSIFQVLSLTANGAKKQTRAQMLKVLQYDRIEKLNQMNKQLIEIIKGFSTVDIANAVFTRFTPLKSFVAITKKYSAPVEPLISEKQVNNWVSNKTHGKITKIIDELTSDIVMILINAVYFKGEWVLQFKKEYTKPLPFYNLGKEEIKVDTMEQTSRFLYYEDKNVQAISLKFKEDYMSAIIILPAEGIDINTYISTLDDSEQEYNKINAGLKTAKVHLQLPKFEVDFSEELNQVLKDLGMIDAFNPPIADFTGLYKKGGLYISKVLHKTYLKVNEEGTEAAAVTAVVVSKSMKKPVQEQIYEMKVNRPFLFFLKNDKLASGHDLLFMSKIEKFE